MLLFLLQILLLLILFWTINISKYFDDDIDNTREVEDTDDWQYLVLITKFICSVILHITL